MKIDRRNPEHLKWLAISAANSCLAVVARPFLRRGNVKRIVFYGHTLNGNLKVFYDFLNRQDGYVAYFLALDSRYHQRLKASSGRHDTILSGLSPRDMLTVARADAIITSHGLHLFWILRALTTIKFVDVWHGVSYKGFGPKEFDHLYAHDEVWVSSKEMRELYIDRYKFKPEQVKVTGYGRTDPLVNGTLNKQDIIKKYSIPKAKKYVLIAPTWKQDVPGRSVLPFGMKEDVFFPAIDELARRYDAHVIFRTHLNSGEEMNVTHLKHISFMPYSKYEVVEDFLFIADILVTDWSSIGTDYLPLKRPAIFLDVPAPFRHGFNLGPEHRYGDVVGSLEELTKSLEHYLAKPEDFMAMHGTDVETTIASAYGPNLDGRSVERYFENLKRLIGTEPAAN